MNITQSVVPPQSGENVRWICIKCGRKFSAHLPQNFFYLGRFSFFDRKPKCPECSSRLVMQDPSVVY